ncbi:hypothetical protein OC846_004943 [Tilletia horrida]|uniref:Uncharacterized protein n=1 Tax=Tilletia horrida TaxID=155126 RepID=A0AAN6JQ00_9BASI|nr:hypothetical protein OC846_004943 [Tilletia horrida]KAK0564612.1 hypothetical protein OC861_004202 [Tilletia horrida]
MRTTLSIAALSALAASSAASVISERATTCSSANQFNCTGQVIVGNLYVRKPDHQVPIAGFSKDSTLSPYPFLTTRFHGVNTSYTRQFAFQVCDSLTKKNSGDQTVKVGFLSPNLHRSKAVSIDRTNGTPGHPFQSLIDLPKHDTCLDGTAVQQLWHLYPNQSLAITGVAPGSAVSGGYGFGPVVTSSSNGQNEFVGVQFTNKSGYNPDGLVNPFGYALELQARES